MEQSGAIKFLFCVQFHQTTSSQVKKLSSVVNMITLLIAEGRERLKILNDFLLIKGEYHIFLSVSVCRLRNIVGA